MTNHDVPYILLIKFLDNNSESEFNKSTCDLVVIWTGTV